MTQEVAQQGEFQVRVSLPHSAGLTVHSLQHLMGYHVRVTIISTHSPTLAVCYHQTKKNTAWVHMWTRCVQADRFIGKLFIDKCAQIPTFVSRIL